MKMASRRHLLPIFVFLSLVSSQVQGIGIELRRRTERCVFEEVGEYLLVVGNYYTKNAVEVRIVDEKLKTIRKESSAGGHDKFAFTTTTDGVYGICFNSQTSQDAFVDILVGVDAKDYSEVVKREHLEPVELSMLHVEEEVQSLLTLLIHQREHEMTMAKTTSTTLHRVFYLSIFVILVVAAVGVWEARHIGNYLKEKKII